MMPGRVRGGALAIFMGVSVISLLGGLIVATALMGAASIPIWMVGMITTGVVLRGPVGRAIAGQIAGEQGGELQAVADHAYAELDEIRHRLLEVEERLDFAERMLAQRSAESIGPPAGEDGTDAPR